MTYNDIETYLGFSRDFKTEKNGRHWASIVLRLMSPMTSSIPGNGLDGSAVFCKTKTSNENSHARSLTQYFA